VVAFDHIDLHPGDALLIVDVQRDFLPGGSLAVPAGDAVIEPLNRYIAEFRQHGFPVIATRDWHPPDHCSFAAQGGIWPSHCVAGTAGATFAETLQLPPLGEVVSKGTDSAREAYSGFEGTELHANLNANRIHRLFIGGLATDYCVLKTVKDALRLGYHVLLLEDAVRAVNIQPHDGAQALQEMRRLGAVAIRFEDLRPWIPEAARC
jgi:nicotinamidase/pyrazinamidase